MTILSLPVLTIMPEFSNPPQITGVYKQDMADVSAARRIAANLGQRPIHTLSMKFRFNNRPDAMAYEDFMDGVAGKWGQFWLPSWHAELAPVAGIAQGGTSLQIQSVNYPTVYAPASNAINLGNYIFLLAYNGTLFVSQVTAASTSSGVDTLTLATAAPQAFVLGQFFVGFMYCVNSINDDVTLTFNGINDITTDLGVTEAMEIAAGTGN